MRSENVQAQASARMAAGREQLLDSIEKCRQQCPDNQRLMIGIAGAPASGKSTLAQWLVEHLNNERGTQHSAVLVPMDGYHLDNSVLDRYGWRSVKGAPHTFDAVGFRQLLERIAAPMPAAESRDDENSVTPIYIPVFDRAMDLARCAGSSVDPQHRIVVVEGNYLLLERPVWQDISQYLHLSVFLDVPEDVLEQRLIQRWLEHGLSADAARQRALSNDIPNAQVVTRESAAAHLMLGGVRQ